MAKREGPARRKGGMRRSTVVPVGTMQSLPAETCHELEAIKREYLEKELALSSVHGPHSTPTEPHYPKSFRAPPTKDEP